MNTVRVGLNLPCVTCRAIHRLDLRRVRKLNYIGVASGAAERAVNGAGEHFFVDLQRNSLSIPLFLQPRRAMTRFALNLRGGGLSRSVKGLQQQRQKRSRKNQHQRPHGNGA